MQKIKKIFFNISIYILVVFIFSFCAELIIRLNPRLYCVGYKPSRNDRIVYELYPGYKIKSLNAEISSQGLPDRYFPVKKDSNVFRIAVVGDSVSFGWKVGAENSFPKILEKMLNEKKDRKFEIINFSVPGYNTSQEYEILKERAIKFEPDMVIVVYCANDTHICNYFKPQITFLNYLYNKSYLVHLSLRGIDLMMMRRDFSLKRIWLSFKKNVLGMFYYDKIIYPYPGLEETISIERDPPDSKEYVPKAYWYMLGYENYRIHLFNIYNLLKKHDIRFISCGNFDRDVNREALKINQELGIENIVNFGENFARETKSVNDIYLPGEIYGHWNIQGHSLAAEYLYRFLETQFGL